MKLELTASNNFKRLRCTMTRTLYSDVPYLRSGARAYVTDGSITSTLIRRMRE